MQKIRQSALNDAERCLYMCNEIWGALGSPETKKEDQDRNKYNETGILFHEVMEYWGKCRIEGTPITLENLHALMDDKMNTSLDEYYDTLDEKEMYRVSLHEQIDWTWDNANLAFLVPIGVEVTFDLSDLIEGIVPVTGTIDRISGDLEQKRIILEDYKTGRVYTKKELASNMQATLYSLAFYKQFGFMPEEFIFYFTKHKKIKSVKITPDFLKAGMERILSVYFKIAEGTNEPNKDKSVKYFCNHFCSVKPKCPLFKKRNNNWDKVG